MQLFYVGDNLFIHRTNTTYLDASDAQETHSHISLTLHHQSSNTTTDNTTSQNLSCYTNTLYI